MFCKIFIAAKTVLDMVTCKIRHFYNMSTAWPREVDGSKTFMKMFYFTCNHGLSVRVDIQSKISEERVMLTKPVTWRSKRDNYAGRRQSGSAADCRHNSA